MSDNLQFEAIEWAIKNIEKYGDTDIFPIPFEYQAIKDNWEEIRDNLSIRDLSRFSMSASQIILMPKPDGTFRVAKQLDPLDSLFYVAIMYEIAPNIESYRVAKEQNIACSYRIDIQANGKIFQDEAGWDDFHSRSKKIARSGKYKNVLVLDIADFYNQISHHRIENTLELANISSERAKNIENMLNAMTAKHSKGLPVGPIPSIVLAEACLDDVDKRLLGKGVMFTRYVDDFRVFCESKGDALLILQDLTEYLYTSHRLAFQSHKTKILSIDHFIKQELEDPKEQEERSKVTSINEFIHSIYQEIGYVITEEDIDKNTESKINIDNLYILFDACLNQRPLKLGFARYLLRRASMLRTRTIYSLVCENLEKLVPVFPEVCTYFEKTLNLKSAVKVKDYLSKFLSDNDYGKLPFVRVWALDLFSKKPFIVPFEVALKYAEESHRALGLRPAALLAREYKKIDWIRSHKENWKSHSPWERRAILWAASILPMDERKPWLGVIRDSASDVLEKSVAIKSLTFKL